MELILRSNQVVGEMKDIIYKCYRYRADSDTVRFTAGRQCVILIMSMTKEYIRRNETDVPAI